MEFDYRNIILQPIAPSWMPGDIQAAILRLDLLHPQVSGNKWFKLKYNLAAAGKRSIVTFGGAWSNHLAATAAACALAGIPCTAVVRGERPAQLSSTLMLAEASGMQLVFISRTDWRQKTLIDWAVRFPDAYIVPEGGNNAAGALGCEEILKLADTSSFTHILCAVGTGTTMAGLINSALPHQHVYGYTVLKGAEYLQQEVSALLKPGVDIHWQLIHDFHEGGYAKVTPGLIGFMNDFYRETQVPLDVVYTAKLLQGFSRSSFPAGSKVLLIHTGGLQGNSSLPAGTLVF